MQKTSCFSFKQEWRLAVWLESLFVCAVQLNFLVRWTISKMFCTPRHTLTCGFVHCFVVETAHLSPRTCLGSQGWLPFCRKFLSLCFLWDSSCLQNHSKGILFLVLFNWAWGSKWTKFSISGLWAPNEYGMFVINSASTFCVVNLSLVYHHCYFLRKLFLIAEFLKEALWSKHEDDKAVNLQNICSMSAEIESVNAI